MTAERHAKEIRHAIAELWRDDTRYSGAIDAIVGDMLVRHIRAAQHDARQQALAEAAHMIGKYSLTQVSTLGDIATCDALLERLHKLAKGTHDA